MANLRLAHHQNGDNVQIRGMRTIVKIAASIRHRFRAAVLLLLSTWFYWLVIGLSTATPVDTRQATNTNHFNDSVYDRHMQPINLCCGEHPPEANE